MKKLVLLLVALFSLSLAQAQMEDGSVCPNFTATDINGNTYNLYDLLDQGKSVVIDVSATWCGPCWNYHQTHALDSVWTKYGPNGTDEMFVFWIEGDASTGMADLMGQTSASQGDWVTGTPFPIVDDASLATLLEIGYFPTIYMVCPNRIIHEAGQVGYTTLYADGQACPAKTQGTDMTMLSYNGNNVFCPSGSITPSVTLQNNGTDTITSATIETYVNGNLTNTDNWTGSMATYDVNTINLTPLAGLSGAPVVTFSVNTSGDLVTTNDEVQVNMSVSNYESEQTIEIAIKPDNYPGEISWELLDGSGTVIDSRPSGFYSGSALQVHTVNLGSNVDCFTFKIYDDYGDGICCAYGNGYYEVRDGSNSNVIFSGGNYDDEEANAFQNSKVVAIEDELGDLVNVYPTVTDGTFKVELNTQFADGLIMNVINPLGQVVARRTFEDQGIYEVNLQGMAAGFYTVHLQGDNLAKVKKIILE
jgi:hypothetical protein